MTKSRVCMDNTKCWQCNSGALDRLASSWNSSGCILESQAQATITNLSCWQVICPLRAFYISNISSPLEAAAAECKPIPGVT